MCNLEFGEEGGGRREGEGEGEEGGGGGGGYSRLKLTPSVRPKHSYIMFFAGPISALQEFSSHAQRLHLCLPPAAGYRTPEHLISCLPKSKL